MASKSIIDRVLLLATAVCAAGLVWQLTVLLTSKGKSPANHGVAVTASASAATHPSVLASDQPQNKPDLPAVRVVYPDVAAPKTTTKITDAVPSAVSAEPSPVVATAAPVAAPPATSNPPGTSVVPVALVSPALVQGATPTASPDDGGKSQPVPNEVASLDPVEPANTAPAPQTTPSDGQSININNASVEALNRLKGGGHIGAAIASHRPYKSVDELVKRRVLRRDVLDRIRGQIAAE